MAAVLIVPHSRRILKYAADVEKHMRASSADLSVNRNDDLATGKRDCTVATLMTESAHRFDYVLYLSVRNEQQRTVQLLRPHPDGKFDRITPNATKPSKFERNSWRYQGPGTSRQDVSLSDLLSLIFRANSSSSSSSTSKSNESSQADHKRCKKDLGLPAATDPLLMSDDKGTVKYEIDDSKSSARRGRRRSRSVSPIRRRRGKTRSRSPVRTVVWN